MDFFFFFSANYYFAFVVTQSFREQLGFVCLFVWSFLRNSAFKNIKSSEDVQNKYGATLIL